MYSVITFLEWGASFSGIKCKWYEGSINIFHVPLTSMGRSCRWRSCNWFWTLRQNIWRLSAVLDSRLGPQLCDSVAERVAVALGGAASPSSPPPSFTVHESCARLLFHLLRALACDPLHHEQCNVVCTFLKVKMFAELPFLWHKIYLKMPRDLHFVGT
jgi:hypothetical protein